MEVNNASDAVEYLPTYLQVVLTGAKLRWMGKCRGAHDGPASLIGLCIFLCAWFSGWAAVVGIVCSKLHKHWQCLSKDVNPQNILGYAAIFLLLAGLEPDDDQDLFPFLNPMVRRNLAG